MHPLFSILHLAFSLLPLSQCPSLTIAFPVSLCIYLSLSLPLSLYRSSNCILLTHPLAVSFFLLALWLFNPAIFAATHIAKLFKNGGNSKKKVKNAIYFSSCFSFFIFILYLFSFTTILHLSLPLSFFLSLSPLSFSLFPPV